MKLPCVKEYGMPQPMTSVLCSSLLNFDERRFKWLGPSV
jgi:hypothetical protein